MSRWDRCKVGPCNKLLDEIDLLADPRQELCRFCLKATGIDLIHDSFPIPEDGFDEEDEDE